MTKKLQHHDAPINPDDLHKRFERFKSAAQEAGVKLTHQRIEIFQAVAASQAHPSAEEVYQNVRARMPTISLDTVYRTLWLFLDMGLLKTFGHREDKTRFDANLEQHHHYRCIECGLVLDFESESLNHITLPKSLDDMGQILTTQIEVQGICHQCTNQGSKTRKD